MSGYCSYYTNPLIIIDRSTVMYRIKPTNPYASEIDFEQTINYYLNGEREEMKETEKKGGNWNDDDNNRGK